MKKTLALLLVLMLILVITSACNNTGSDELTPENIKIGVVYIGPLADQGYTYNHYIGALKMISNLGLREDQFIPKFSVGTEAADVTRAINELIRAGCHIIFATSFTHQLQMIEAARENPDVVFCHATGANAHGSGLDNYHNYFAKIHEARYLGGIAAGLATESNILGYVAAHPYDEVISGFTAFYLGALSVNPNVVMEVIYINSWGDPPLEQQVATRLIELGADVIAQHSDSVTPAIAAEEGGAFHVGYNNDMRSTAPNASLLSPRIDWSIYMTFAVQSVLSGTQIPVDWGEGLASGAAFITELNDAIIAPGTREAIDAARAEIISGNRQIFSGHLKDNYGQNTVVVNYAGDTIFEFTGPDSVFHESTETSAPGFNAIISGINIIS